MPLDDSQELFYQVDKDDNEIGSVTRKKAHSDPSIIHRSVALFIINPNNEMLFQKRSAQKDMNGGEWSYGTSGHVSFGETYKQTAIRELQEELGIKNLNVSFLSKFLFSSQKETEMVALYTIKVSKTQLFKLDPTEIDEITWVKLSKIPQFIATHTVADWTIEELKHAHYL